MILWEAVLTPKMYKLPQPFLPGTYPGWNQSPHLLPYASCPSALVCSLRFKTLESLFFPVPCPLHRVNWEQQYLAPTSRYCTDHTFLCICIAAALLERELIWGRGPPLCQALDLRDSLKSFLSSYLNKPRDRYHDPSLPELETDSQEIRESIQVYAVRVGFIFTVTCALKLTLTWSIF